MATKMEMKQAKQRERILECLRSGATAVEACQVTGIGTTTFYRWQADNEWFKEEVETVKFERLMAALQVLNEQANGHYVTEESVKELKQGPVKVTRRRWVAGKLSALKLVLKRLESGFVAEGAELLADTGGTVDEVDRSAEKGGDVSRFEVPALRAQAVARRSADGNAAMSDVRAVAERSAVDGAEMRDAQAGVAVVSGEVAAGVAEEFGSEPVNVSRSEAKSESVAAVAAELRQASMRRKEEKKRMRKMQKASRRKNR